MKCRNISIRGKESCQEGKNNFSLKVKNRAGGGKNIFISGNDWCMKGKNIFHLNEAIGYTV